LRLQAEGIPAAKKGSVTPHGVTKGKNDMTKQAAIYARVSSDDQAEKGYSLPSQIEACQRFAEQKGFDVAAVYQDDISGAKPITSRPDGYQLQRVIESGQIRAVIVYCVDRLSRDIVDLLTTVRNWLRAGVEIHALDMGQVTSELDIVLVIKGWQGSDERQKIRERTSRGRNSKARAGKVVGAGTPPYGYTYSDGELLIEESQAQIVRMIFDWYTRGDEHGNMMSLLAIARRLTEMRIPRPGESKSLIWKMKRGKAAKWDGQKWNVGTVHKLVINERYCGVLRYGKSIGVNGIGGKRPPDEHILIDVPAIVSRETWELAQARRAYNSKIAKRRTKHEYLLRGLIYCGCGRVMVGMGKGNLYACTRRYNPTGNEEACKEPLVSLGLIECVTWNYIMSLITDSQKFEEKLREAQAQESANMRPKQKELDHVQALLKGTENEAEQIARELHKTKGIIREKLEQQGEEVNRRYQALTRREAELQEALTFELTERNIDNLLEFREAVSVGLENPTFEDKRRWLEILQTKVTVTNGIAVVTCRLGGKPFKYSLSGYNISRNWVVS
jgi:site-specific DNA recombinase